MIQPADALPRDKLQQPIPIDVCRIQQADRVYKALLRLLSVPSSR